MHLVYEQIASHFSSTRYKASVKSFIHFFDLLLCVVD